MKKSLSLILVSAILILAPMARADTTEFNYNGKVNANGQPFNGTGKFKFALVNAGGTQTYWVNDSATYTGAEPTAAISATVTNGFFSVTIGDTTIPGMAALDPSIFNNGALYLRTWFSDGTGFEKLSPDRRVVNPGLLGLRSKQNIILYVSSATGDDSFSGLQSNRPKKSIQAAWNTLPTILETSATIQVAAGVYRETVRLRGKTCAGDAQIWIIGNSAQPSLVRVTGANAGAETIAVKDNGFVFSNQRGVIVSGISFDYYTNNAIKCGLSDVDIGDCIVHHTLGPGIFYSDMCRSDIRGTEIYSTNGVAPVYMQNNCLVGMNGNYIHDETGYGVSVLTNCTLGVLNTHFKNVNSCIEVSYAGVVSMGSSAPYKSVMENATYGFTIDANGTVVNVQTGTTFINVVNHVRLGAYGPIAAY